ncbi:class I SAM-dependent RNA methyltransferase [Eubacterium sp. MSJ-13]|uniref:class I SAM-dependent RNA methyltransferase n=1 Tax=Eubacterium sp. MSJ-13 TaxID=2841513 RepID=UPI001C124183|nr:class I SAM-dependent RNA methyltransferase [Eubacterium sp. MSJ-13]MBU5479539.1 class I SAM-dependent RNA methyltransferase [Eubacterium sp. MSJ-13]
MKKGNIYEGIVKKVEFPNKAYVEVIDTDENGNEQKTLTLVKGALPGQKIRFRAKKVRKDKSQGILLEIIEKSPLETAEPMCSQFGKCGGCSYQTLPYEKQLELKKNQVLEIIDNVYKILDSSLGIKKDYIYDGILPSPDIKGYRNKMEFSFGDEYKGGPLTLGLHKKGSVHDIVNASGCQIVDDDYSKVIDCIVEYFREKQIPHYNKNTHQGVLRHLLVRRAVSTGELLVALVTSSQQDISEYVSEVSEKLNGLDYNGKLTGFIHIINDGLGDVVKSDEMRIISGKDWFTEKILGLQFKISPFSFFQTNTKGAEVLYTRARDYVLGGEVAADDKNSVSVQMDASNLGIDNMNSEKIENRTPSVENKKDIEIAEDRENLEVETNGGFKDKVVFDLYSGTGTIAQIIAPVAKKVIGVEIVEEAVEAAKENAAINGLDNCEFIAGDVLKVIDEIDEKPDYIILDPPREGIHPKAIRKIIDYGVENIVYISCKPTSLSQDLATFETFGYHVERVSNVDMFPGTVHCETIIKLSLKNKGL